ncbi:MAG: hypothetical protein M3R25_06075 [Bacteroidota bacterium]|nr:hypothetical protein [Bacteroidota bacterium]
MKSFCLLSAFVAFFLFSCKPASTTVQEETSSPVADSMVVNPNTTSNRISGGHDFTFLTNKLYHYKASSSVGKPSTEQPYAGQWIDLDPDGTYKAGTLQQQTHTGKWGYNDEMKVLQLQPNDSNYKPSEWKVMHNDDMMVWVGTQSYNNNATQIQLVRSETLPQ